MIEYQKQIQSFNQLPIRGVLSSSHASARQDTCCLHFVYQRSFWAAANPGIMMGVVFPPVELEFVF